MYLVSARYSDMRMTGQFLCENGEFKRDDLVVLQTDRGTELGKILSGSTPYTSPAEQAPAAQQAGENAPAEAASAESAPPPGAQTAPGKVLRKAGSEDMAQVMELRCKGCQTEAAYCKKKIREFNLPMKLVHVEHLLGGEKIIFYFLADGRVDFRELVKDLAREYRTRIEMKQIGVRDEARLLGDKERCGMELCCRAFLKSFEPITMKMAKNQKATLDPSKISGHCGRLMCCLRYEDAIYAEYKRKLPKKGSRVVTAKGVGEVVNYDILSQTVTIETDDRRRLTVSANDVTGRDTSPRNQRELARPPDNRANENNRPNGNDRAGRDNGKTAAPAKESGGPDDRA
jgi:cell fate regulator YaaT (PSP1 superfamily)